MARYEKPYDTETMRYDATLHQYILMPKVINDLGGSYKDDGVRDRTLKAISRRVYGWIYKTANSGNRYYFEFELACNPLLRPVIEEALTAQLEADLASGYNDIALQSPIDFVKGTILDRDAIERNVICLEAEDALRSFRSPNILFAGDLGIRLERNSPNRYTEWEY